MGTNKDRIIQRKRRAMHARVCGKPMREVRKIVSRETLGGRLHDPTALSK